MRLILFNGWGYETAALQPLAQVLAAQGVEVQIEALPAVTPTLLSGWVEDAHRRLSDAVLGGWSLGGIVATYLAVRRGSACPGLCTLTTNPTFVMRADWPGMLAATFKVFHESCQADAGRVLQRFAHLCLQGEPGARQQLSALRATLAAPDPGLLRGLDCLAGLDSRAVLQGLACPQLHLFGEADALVPVAVAAQLQQALPQARIQVLPGGHALPWSQAQNVGKIISQWLCDV